MRDLAVLFLHLLATVARLAGSSGARAVVAESVLVKQQLLILCIANFRFSSISWVLVRL
jgi:putative transposase